MSDETGGRSFEITIREVRKGMVIATLTGVGDRDTADALKGLRLYVARDALPPPEDDEFYHSDLLGLTAVGTDGEAIGTVRAILPAGEAEVLEIDRGPGRETVLVPFTKDAVPRVDLANGRLEVVPPELQDDDEEHDDATNDDAMNEDGKRT